jgi:hypothetical protein
MTQGRLNPEDSKPGDMLVLKLQDDVKSNGALILKKGTTITGIVRNVKRGEAGNTSAMLEIEWLAPVTQRNVAQSLSIALQSVAHVNTTYKDEPQADNASASFVAAAGSGTIGNVAASVAENLAMKSMPSVVTVDQQTSATIENSLGMSSSDPLFKVGQGQVQTAGGSPQTVDLFSHLNNDTVITSASKDFEISTGAQMQLLVGVKR